MGHPFSETGLCSTYPPRGFFRMGLEHGAYCVGCCWALMLLLFAGGVMNLAVIAALTVFVVFENGAARRQRRPGKRCAAACGWRLGAGDVGPVFRLRSRWNHARARLAITANREGGQAGTPRPCEVLAPLSSCTSAPPRE